MNGKQGNMSPSSAGKRLGRSLAHLLQPLWAGCNERMLGIVTEPLRSAPDAPPSDPTRPWWRGEVSDIAKYDDNYAFASPDYWYVWKVARLLRCVPQDIVYDLGSGTGRILCVLARKHVAKCVGIELSEQLCDMARSNALRLRGRRSPIEIVCGDATKADLSDGTIYFMYNPFGPDTMREVIANIQKSLCKNPRSLTIVYYNSIHAPVLEADGWLNEYHHFYTAGGKRVSFWTNRFTCCPESP